MQADASDRDHQHQEAPTHGTPAGDHSWMYRSEAFAEDLDDAPRPAVVADPGRRSAVARPVRAVLRSLGGFSPRPAG